MLDLIKFYQGNIKFVKVGDAKGIDKNVRDSCNFFNIPYEVLVAEWDKYGKAAGYMRNNDIVEDVKLLIAIPSIDSKGTINAIEIALKKNIEVHVFNYYFYLKNNLLTYLILTSESLPYYKEAVKNFLEN